MMYICQIELNDITPKIWRQFQFHADVTFDQLHNIIQTVMGWENYHLYEFRLGSTRISLPDPNFPDEGRQLNARKETVEQHVNREKTAFTYLYDFGDGWEHTITVMSIQTEESAGLLPLCLEGERSCPPEDVGGVPAYCHMAEALSDPRHDQHAMFKDWLTEGYDPEHFSCDEVNAELREQGSKLVPQSRRKQPVKLTKAGLNKRLKQMSREELMELVKDGYSASKDMQRFLAARLIGKEAVESLFHEYQDKIKQEFFPERGHAKLRLQEAKNAIAEFKKLTGSVKHTLELKLVYVELSVLFSNTYGDIDARFYDQLMSMYEDVIDILNEHETAELFHEYKERIEAAAWNAAGFGWGVHEVMMDLYDDIRWK
ncbi:plasmid pRiA4b ORF-3 family protein [Paenibacillus thiaminolyticus]|uniref:Plasmid pRiA4b ORF-3 family protein n=1 Tax=Paenibacillus thiaminolyticus TaxID=49283 RepID=A0A3A3GMY2_PANTH|nr:plasmid pRiA4b ORF-3 family protein [Paenibacillus thiaminolyticus]RJG26237.1 plasmid pRiA4b ORF-3 family protein [Paenibacillus thiaminolyticus]